MMASGIRQASQTRRNAFPGHLSKERWNKLNAHIHAPLTDESVLNVLKSNDKIVDEFLLECVGEERILSLLEKKQCLKGNTISTQKTKKLHERYTIAKVSDISRNLLQDTNEDSDILTHLIDITQIVSQSLEVEHFTVYIPINGGTRLAVVDPQDFTLKPCVTIEPMSTVAGCVAANRTVALIDDISNDVRYTTENTEAETTKSVLCIPVISPKNELIAVVEFSRSYKEPSFTDVEFHIANAFFCWLSASLYEIDVVKSCNELKTTNEFLLNTAKTMFEEVTDTDVLVRNIMGFTKNIVNADRCALFLLDEEADQLYAEYFDEGFHENGLPFFTKKTNIRFQRNKGIAGHVAKTGEVVNVWDAYSDPRFNQEIDKETGYITRNILCMPIINKNKIAGVIEMVNSMSGDHFTQADESAFKMFGVYCALALHYSRIYDVLNTSKAKCKVTLDVIKYHILGDEEEFKKLAKRPYLTDKALPIDFDKYQFIVDGYENFLPHFFIYMMKDIVEDHYVMQADTLCRFVLTVKKNYRSIQYHNWKHGFYVSHALWCINKHNPDVLTRLEKMAMIVAGLCHDVDHRGYNNAFFKKLKLPLAALYSTSIMEEHHYRHTITILQSEGHNIFSGLNPQEYKEVLHMIRESILATDLASHFPNLTSIDQLLASDAFDYNDADMRSQLKSLMMVGADLCCSMKPWEPQRRMTDQVYAEFYSQGDEERRHGLQPDSIMDRFREQERPNHQMAFSDFICMPVYEAMFKLLPGTKEMLSACLSNRLKWQEIADRQKKM